MKPADPGCALPLSAARPRVSAGPLEAPPRTPSLLPETMRIQLSVAL